MGYFEKILVIIFVVGAVVFTFHGTNFLADHFLGPSPRIGTVEKEKYEFSRELLLLLTRMPITILFFLLGLYFYRKLNIEEFGVAFLSFGILASTIEASLFSYRTMGTYAVSLLLVILSMSGLAYLKREKIFKKEH